MVRLKTENVVPVTDLQRAAGRIVAKAVESGDPIIITQHGRPAVVLVDCKKFEELEQGAIDIKAVGTAMGGRERELREELQRIVAKIVASYDPERVVLFGSLAHGQVTDSSDIDLVVIKKTKQRFWERLKELAKLVRPKLACDMLVYTPEEWDQAVKEGREFFSHEVAERGKVIYDRAA